MRKRVFPDRGQYSCGCRKDKADNRHAEALQAYQRTARTYTNGAGGLSKAVVAKA